MKQLQKARIEDDSDKKLSILNKLISKNPNESAVYFALAETYMQEGNISLKENLRIKSC